MNVLVTGGAGYIGSHTVVQLIDAGHQPIIVDNLSNSNGAVIGRIEKITGMRPVFYRTDLRDQPALTAIFKQHPIDAVIHFAGFKAVGESVAEPLKYYDNNVGGTISLLQTMDARDIHQLIFSSSATVYGDPASVPIPETAAIKPTNPYGQTKGMIEQLLRDVSTSNPKMAIAALRYFNPIGAHPSGLIGEDPHGTPNNLLPYLAQVAIGKRPAASVFGDDYDTPDGTGVRDYIHVADLAAGHLKALEHLRPGYATYNLGTGHGSSVLDVINALEAASKQKIPYQIEAQRPGDVATVYADVAKAQHELKWQATHTLADACADLWNWQRQNPDGYNT